MARDAEIHNGLKLESDGTVLIDSHGGNPLALQLINGTLRFAERMTFGIVGLLLAAVALTLAFRSLLLVYQLIVSPSALSIALTAQFLDLILLILMLAEIIYTVTLSLRGAVLSPQPFLIVGLIAVIRRILVITVQEVQSNPSAGKSILSGSTVDLAVLTLVAIAFVAAMCLLQRRGGSSQMSE